MSTIHIPIGSVNVALTFPDEWRVRVLSSAVASLPARGVSILDFSSPDEQVSCDVTAAPLDARILTPDATEQFFRSSAAQYSLPIEKTGRIAVAGEQHFTANYTNTKGQHTKMYAIHYGEFELAFACFSQDPAQQALKAQEPTLDAIVTSLTFELCSPPVATVSEPRMTDRQDEIAVQAFINVTQSTSKRRAVKDLSEYCTGFIIACVLFFFSYHNGMMKSAIVFGLFAVVCLVFAVVGFRKL